MGNGRTLLSQWLQPPLAHAEEDCSAADVDSTDEVATQRDGDQSEERVAHTDDTGRTRSVAQWNAIFGRPARQSLLVKLRVQADALARLADSVSGSTRAADALQPTARALPARKRQCIAPFAVEHVRDTSSSTVRALPPYPRRAKSTRVAPAAFASPLPRPAPLAVATPVRALATCDELIAQLDGLSVPLDARKYAQAHPFELGEFETQMWCQKYASEPLARQACARIASWLARVQADDTEGNVLVVAGPTGSGKTSAVHAAAAQCSTFVFEVPSSVKRTGRALGQLLAGISQNHAVHSAGRVVILVDEVDVVFEPEAAAFWATLAKYAANTRRPVVLTCAAAEHALQALVGVRAATLVLPAPPLDAVADLAYATALGEGHQLDRARVRVLAEELGGDLRRVLTQLQFWCQMGVGGHPSGSDWAPKQHELAAHDRVLSVGTWFPLASDALPDTLPKSLPNSLPHALPSAFADASLHALHDGCARSLAPGLLRRAPPEETLWVPGALVLTECYDSDVPASRARAAAVDIEPYRRFMAAADFRRAQLVENEVRAGTASSRRLALRGLAAAGLDTRQHLNMHYSDLLLILRDGFRPELLGGRSRGDSTSPSTAVLSPSV